MSKIETLDQQLFEFPDEVVFCKNCVVSNLRPRTLFNDAGVCSACQWSFTKDHEIDWDARERELRELCDRYRSTDGSYDCIVPGSGGKDSAFVAHQLKTKYGMHPLCVTWAPFEWTQIGWENLRKFIAAGFNNLVAHPAGDTHRKLARLAFELKGDAFEPFVYGQKAFAFHMAEKFNIKLIFYGENGELEYGGSTKYMNLPKEGPEEWERAYFKGAGVDKLVEVGLDRGIFKKEELTPQSLAWYKAPSPDIVAAKGLEMHWFSYYKKWTPQENFYYAMKYTGMETNDAGRSEGTYTKYASLDDRSDGYHFYFAYLKFGLGRASRDAQQDIRRHHITRDEGVALVKRYDGEFPKRHLHWFLDYLSISEEFFWEVCDFYRGRSPAWEKVQGQWKLKHTVR